MEADNRLVWLFGRLDKRFGEKPFFVHLRRNDADVARSYETRAWWEGSITRAYRNGILMLNQDTEIDLCADFVNTVNENISLFLSSNKKSMNFRLENAENDFSRFWSSINAEGDLDAALMEWRKKSNTTEEMLQRQENSSKQTSQRILRSTRAAIKHVAKRIRR
jgi:hypothetical protein